MNYFGYDTNAMAVGETNQGIVVRLATRFCALAHRPIVSHMHLRPHSHRATHPLSSPRRAARCCAVGEEQDDPRKPGEVSIRYIL